MRCNHTLLYSILTSHAHQILAFVLTVNMKPNIRYLTYINSFHAKTNQTRFYLKIKTTHRAYNSIIVVLTLQETIIPQKIIKTYH